MKPNRTGAYLGLAAALLFGASTPFAKALLKEVDPGLLAGLLYLGAGIGWVHWDSCAEFAGG